MKRIIMNSLLTLGLALPLISGLNAAPAPQKKQASQPQKKATQQSQAKKSQGKKVANQKAQPNRQQAKRPAQSNKKPLSPAELEKRKQKEQEELQKRAMLQAYFSKPKSGLFIGLGVGASVITRSADLTGLSGRQSGDMSLGFGANWEARLGWQQYITNKMGFRIYASYDQTWAFPGQMIGLGLKGLRRDYVFIDKVLLNADYLLDLLAESSRRISVFAGVYGGWAEANQKYYKTSNSSGGGSTADSLVGNNYDDSYVFGINAGIALVIKRHHKVEVYARVPMLDINSQEYFEAYTNSTSNALVPVDTMWRVPTFGFGYSFVF